MSGHRGFYCVMALVPVVVAGLLYATVQTVTHTVHQYKVQHLLVNDPCNPQTEIDDKDWFPQQPPLDGPAPPHLDGPCSVFHPLKDFDDLVHRYLLDKSDDRKTPV
jgi:hypothetical protein